MLGNRKPLSWLSRWRKNYNVIFTLSKFYIWEFFCFYSTFATGKKTIEGNGAVPFSIYDMATEILLEKIDALLRKLLQEEPEYFKVKLKIKPTNNVKVYLDGDHGITIEKCIYFNRKLYKLIEEEGLFPPGEYSLEVSSPGVDEPLHEKRQYHRNIGRMVEVVFEDSSKKEGKLLKVDEDSFTIEETSGKGKNMVKKELIIPFDQIKTTTVQIKF